MAPDGYYVHSFFYRLLRPLAIGVLVERAMSYADFSVDPSSVDLLRFDRAACQMLTGAEPFLGADGQVYYRGLDWGRESQHIGIAVPDLQVPALLAAAEDDRSPTT
jgi:hypothetical protein